MILTFGAFFGFLSYIADVVLNLVQLSFNIQNNILKRLVRASVEAVVVVDVTWRRLRI